MTIDVLYWVCRVFLFAAMGYGLTLLREEPRWTKPLYGLCLSVYLVYAGSNPSLVRTGTLIPLVSISVAFTLIVYDLSRVREKVNVLPQGE